MELEEYDSKRELWSKTEIWGVSKKWKIWCEVQNLTSEGCFETKNIFENILEVSATILAQVSYKIILKLMNIDRTWLKSCFYLKSYTSIPFGSLLYRKYESVSETIWAQAPKPNSMVREKITHSTSDAISFASGAESSESFYRVVKYNLVCDLWLRWSQMRVLMGQMAV